MKSKFSFLLSYLPYVFHIIYFNFKYLPLKQAIKLPIFLYRPNLVKCKGKIEIKGDKIRTAMIKLGYNGVSLYPNTGIKWENRGGSVVFNGSCNIGNASAVSIGEKGNLFFGENFKATAALKVACYHKIYFNKNFIEYP